MPFNGSGLFVLPSPEYPAVSNTVIYASTRNTIDSDIAAGLSNVICKDGQTTVTANIPFNGFKLTGVGNPTARSDAATLGRVQDGMPPLTTTGSATAYQIAPSPAIPSYVAGYTVVVQFHVACGASPTLQISGLANPPNLVKRLADGTLANLAADDVPTNWRSRVTLVSATQALVEQTPLTAGDISNTALGSGTADSTTFLKGDRTWATIAASDIPTSALGSGTADSTTFLRGDRTWETPPSPTIASTEEAQAGTNNTKMITPLRMHEGFNATGAAPVYACRAWVNFNGTGTVTIRASGNVSSITDNGTGDYTINFMTAMPDADYCWQGSGMVAGSDVTNGGQSFNGRNEFPPTATSLRGLWKQGNVASPMDSAQINVAIFR